MDDRFSQHFKPGEPITHLTAETYNAITGAIEARRNLVVSAPLEKHGSGPDVIAVSHPEGFYARLSGSTSPYSFTEKYGTTGGGWSTMVRTGTTNAYEVNGVASLNNKYAWLEPGYAGDYRFQHVVNGSGGGGGGTGSLPGCACATPPATIYQHVTNPITGTFEDCTYQYGATPSGLSSLHLGANAYLSTALFTEPSSGDQFYYYLGCFSTIIRISRVFPSSIWASGSPFLDSVLYFWAVGVTGNTCTPFNMSNGTIYFGGNPATTVTLNTTP